MSSHELEVLKQIVVFYLIAVALVAQVVCEGGGSLTLVVLFLLNDMSAEGVSINGRMLITETWQSLIGELRGYVVEEGEISMVGLVL